MTFYKISVKVAKYYPSVKQKDLPIIPDYQTILRDLINNFTSSILNLKIFTYRDSFYYKF